MFISCGQDEPLRSPQKAYFSCVIGFYFVSFFNDHPVHRYFVSKRLHLLCDKSIKSRKVKKPKVWVVTKNWGLIYHSHFGLLTILSLIISSYITPSILNYFFIIISPVFITPHFLSLIIFISAVIRFSRAWLFWWT